MTLRVHILRALFGATFCIGAIACSGDSTDPPEGDAWGLVDEWELEPEPLDMGPADFGFLDQDFFPDTDTPDLPFFDLGPEDLGPEDFGPEDLGSPDLGPPDLGPQGFTTGAPCEDGDECIGGSCFDEGWQDGYCTERDCFATSCVSSGGECIIDGDLNGREAFCAQPCNPNPQPGFSSCREGYVCRASPQGDENATYCLPEVEQPPVTAVDGEACTDGSDCTGGTCITEGEGWPGGYCTTSDCQNRRDCARDGGVDNRCFQNPQGPNICVRICQDTSECRTDYICQPVGGGQGFCVPDPSEPLDVDFDNYPLDVTCAPVSDPAQQRHSFSYTVAPDTTAYMVTSIARDGRQIASEVTDLPSGGTIDYFNGPNSYQNTTAQLLSFASPILTPAQPEFAAQLEAGVHEHVLYSESNEVCSYFLEESTPGNTLDLNIYLVGVPGVNAAQAPMDTNLQATLNFFSTIYAGAGIATGTVRYFDISGADLQSYRVIRSEQAIQELVALSELPGPTEDDALSLNVFFVQSIALGGGAIGISQGLPGPAGIHGTGASGVVFTSEFLGQVFNDPSTNTLTDGNEYTGVVLAHELGHYLGLFHTTEQNIQSRDPLTDTPECRRNQFPNNCPDLNNLMFPFAGVTHTEISADQSFVIGVNPLSKD